MTIIKLTNLCGTVPLTCLNKCHKATIFINAYVAIHSINHTKLSYRIKILQYAPILAILCVILNTVKRAFLHGQEQTYRRSYCHFYVR